MYTVILDKIEPGNWTHITASTKGDSENTDSQVYGGRD